MKGARDDMPDDYSIYTSRGGETWDKIAFDAWTEEALMHVLIAANPDLAHIVIFEGGEKVRIPVMDEPQNTESLPPWRKGE